jgi:hypothetical protein
MSKRGSDARVKDRIFLGAKGTVSKEKKWINLMREIWENEGR